MIDVSMRCILAYSEMFISFMNRNEIGEKYEMKIHSTLPSYQQTKKYRNMQHCTTISIVLCHTKDKGTKIPNVVQSS
jgi:hypothetical protein